jgi:hypothetical protein
LNPDSSKNSKLKVKGLLDIEVNGFARKELEPENSLSNLLEVDIIAIYITQAKYTQKITYTQAKKTRKIAKNNKRVKTSRIFPKYTNQNREDYDPYNLPNIITGEKNSE